ncbi:MAG TPA: SpoIIE family protein phosphatase [Terriglobales bacterium]|jgi:serine phosphatase RsbU (regulator of sigma subunit)
MSTATNNVSSSMPFEDPLQACVPAIRDGQMAAVYYGQRVCGDFYDFVRVNPHRVVFGFFDVAGNLEKNRPIAVPLQARFRAEACELLQPDDSNELDGLVELWIVLNAEIMRAASGVHACPAFLACYDEELHTLAYVNSGHTPGLVKDGDTVRELGATALPLGLFSHSVPDSSLIALGSQQTLLLVSKGIVEAKHRHEEYGLERVRDYLQEVTFNSAHETCVGLLSRVREFMGSPPTHNDVTALSLVRSR